MLQRTGAIAKTRAPDFFRCEGENHPSTVHIQYLVFAAGTCTQAQLARVMKTLDHALSDRELEAVCQRSVPFGSVVRSCSNKTKRLQYYCSARILYFGSGASRMFGWRPVGPTGAMTTD